MCTNIGYKMVSLIVKAFGRHVKLRGVALSVNKCGTQNLVGDRWHLQVSYLYGEYVIYGPFKLLNNVVILHNNYTQYAYKCTYV